MALERIVLNIIPAGEMPVFHCSQYENGRPVIIDLVSSDDDAFLVPEGATVELHCRKVDDNIVTLEPDEVDNNTVTFVSTEQLTACPGDNLCEVVLYADTDPVQTIATLNFILHVEPDPMEGGLTSDTQIHNLTEQIEEITQQVIGDDYYNKTEVDDLLADKADKATTYTKSEVDTALNLKADKANTYTKTQVDSALSLKADKSDTYTKTQVDAALAAKADTTYVDSGLALKANAADVYTKAQTYSQAEVDALIDNIFPTLNASGTIASFTTALTKPLVSVTADSSATTITICGVNLFKFTDTTASSSVSNYYFNFPSKTYTLSFELENATYQNGGAALFDFYNADSTNFAYPTPNVLKRASDNATMSSLTQPLNDRFYFTFTNSLSRIRLNFVTSGYGQWTGKIKNVTLTEGTDKTYHAYSGQTVPVADATTLVTQSGANNVYADVGDVTVQYKYMSM